MSNTKKVLAAMSGGVDSSVAALLLRQDYDVIGVTMRLFTNEDIQLDRQKTCCSLDDVEDARQAAHKLGLAHYVLSFGERFRECVIDRFNRAYSNGLTPNPCIDCNRFIKFDALLRQAQSLGQDYIATGHYVRRRYDEASGRYQLLKGVDAGKDQSYVLYGMTQEQLAHTLFPVGELTKAQTRALAEENGLLNAHKPDSQDICFVPDGDYARFIEAYTGQTFPQGDFIDQDGHPLGRHNGIIRYTIGQRKGLGLSFGTPMYVIAKDAAANTVTLGPNEALFRDTVIAHEVNWLSIACPDAPIRVEAKVRYNQQAQPATLYPLSDDRVQVVFDAPQRAITPGQALVCYRDDLLLCGGVLAGASIPPDGAEPSDGYHP